ncbi:hypothetical protein QYF61_007961, partial [Mycteria americana]
MGRPGRLIISQSHKPAKASAMCLQWWKQPADGWKHIPCPMPPPGTLSWALESKSCGDMAPQKELNFKAVKVEEMEVGAGVKIQKRWRGYYVRKYIHNYYALKKYLEAISVNNEIVRNELQEYAEMKENEEKRKDLEKKEKEKKYQARKMHYLLSTEQ